VWAFGIRGISDDPYVPSVLHATHWDGTVWTSVLPGGGAEETFGQLFGSVAVPGIDEVLAVGEISPDGDANHNLILRWC
jgi:hypothetical protein